MKSQASGNVYNNTQNTNKPKTSDRSLKINKANNVESRGRKAHFF